MTATTKDKPWTILRRRLTMPATLANILTPIFADYVYIGGGVVTLVIIILVVLLVFRR